MSEFRERKFRGKFYPNCWAPLTDHILIREDGGYVVHKNDPNIFGADGSATKIECYTLEYCLAMVECGQWVEINPAYKLILSDFVTKG